MRIMVLNQAPRSPRDPDYHLKVEPLLNSYASPGTQVDLCYPDDFPGAKLFSEVGAQGVHSELPQDVAVGALVRKTVWAEENGYDAVIQSHTLDPGVQAARLAVRIPVIGLFATSLHLAATLADRIGITVPFEHYVLTARRIARLYGMEGFVAEIRSLALPGVQGVDLNAQKGDIFSRAAEQMRALVRQAGAECIIPVGGLLIPYLIDPSDLEREVGVPVLNTKAIGIRFAEMCVGLGISQSARTYPTAKLHPEDFTAYAYR